MRTPNEGWYMKMTFWKLLGVVLIGCLLPGLAAGLLWHSMIPDEAFVQVVLVLPWCALIWSTTELRFHVSTTLIPFTDKVVLNLLPTCVFALPILISDQTQKHTFTSTAVGLATGLAVLTLVQALILRRLPKRTDVQQGG